MENYGLGYVSQFSMGGIYLNALYLHPSQFFPTYRRSTPSDRDSEPKFEKNLLSIVFFLHLLESWDENVQF